MSCSRWSLALGSMVTRPAPLKLPLRREQGGAERYGLIRADRGVRGDAEDVLHPGAHGRDPG